MLVGLTGVSTYIRRGEFVVQAHPPCSTAPCCPTIGLREVHMVLLKVQQFVCVRVHFKYSVGGVLVDKGRDRWCNQYSLVYSTVVFNLQGRTSVEVWERWR